MQNLSTKVLKENQTKQYKILNDMSEKDYYNFMQGITNVYLLQKKFNAIPYTIPYTTNESTNV